MHDSIRIYLEHRADLAPLSRKAIRCDLVGFTGWWEREQQRPFDPSLLHEADVRAWQLARQRDEGARAATIRRAQVSLRGYCAWAVEQGLMTENASAAVDSLPAEPPTPKALPPEACDAILRAARQQPDQRLRLRDEALLALLIYGGLRAQEVCDVQVRDLDLPGGAVAVRYGKGGRSRRVYLPSEGVALLKRYLALRCPDGPPSLGDDAERETLLVTFSQANGGAPRVGLNQRTVQRVVGAYATAAAARYRADAERAPLEQAGRMLRLAERLEHTTPHTLRHSLGRRLLASGADPAIVQRQLGHASLTTTTIYAQPDEDELRAAVERARL